MRTQDMVETKTEKIGHHKWKHLTSTCNNTGKLIFKGPHVYDNTGYCQFVIEVINKLSVDLSIDTCTRSF